MMMNNDQLFTIINALLATKLAQELPITEQENAPAGSPFQVGTAYLIRTATMIQVGRVSALYPGFLQLEDAAWVADTGRFHDALRTGSLEEVEPFPDGCIVALGGIIDATPWKHPLPLKQK